MRSPLSEHPYGEHRPVFPPRADISLDDADMSEVVRLSIYRKLQVMRLFEQKAYDLFMQGLVKGSSHLSIGMEAIAAGFGQAMRPDDYTFATYRGHAHTLARGVPMAPVLSELLGRGTGLMGGKGGSMHLTSAEHGMMGSYAIVGAHLPIANGAAFSAQYRGTDQVAVCFFGDGTTNIGAFHEALSYAATYQLPTVFVCENNLYMEYTSIRDVTPVTRPAADRAPAYGLESLEVDGNDADACFLAATAALKRARAGEGPSLIEATTYRHGGHSRADLGKYRPEPEVQAWLDHDPIVLYRSRLERLGVPATTINEIESEVLLEVERATAEAKDGPLPEARSAYTELWADGGSSWRN